MKEYFSEFYAINDIVHFSLFAWYFYIRIHFLHEMMPEHYAEGKNCEKGLKMLGSYKYYNTTTDLAIISILNFVLYLAMGLKIMSFMRI